MAEVCLRADRSSMLAAAWQSSCWHWIRGRRVRARSCLISVAGSSRLRRKSSDRFFRSPGGLSTTLRKSGRLSSSAHSQRCAKPVRARATWPRSGLRISAKRPSSGIAQTAYRSRTRLFGRIAAPQSDCQALRARGVEADVTATTGLLLDPYFSATKIEWLLDHVPGARTRADAR